MGERSAMSPHRSAVSGLRGDLQLAWKQRDEALAQVKEMEAVLAQKCGEQVAELSAAKAKLAAKKKRATDEASRVKRDQEAAKKEAELANAAMIQAKDAARNKHQLEDKLNKAKLELKVAEEKAKHLTSKASGDRAVASKAAQSGQSNVKSAFSKASSEYGQAMQAKMKVDLASKTVRKLEAQLATIAGSAEARLRVAKEDTKNAAAKVNIAMKAQAATAAREQQVALERAKLVEAEEKLLRKQGEKLNARIMAAKLKKTQAWAAVKRARESENAAMSAANNVPKAVTPAEKAAYDKAKSDVIDSVTAVDKDSPQATYATTIKNVEAALIKSRTEIEHANNEKEKLTKELAEVKAALQTEQDTIQKQKLEKKRDALKGAILAAESRAKKALLEHKKQEKQQKDAIGSVIRGVVMADKAFTKTKKTLEANVTQLVTDRA